MGECKRNERIEVWFDETKEHQLKLSCMWDSGEEKYLFIMLNPSTEDLEKCDLTLDRCISFAKTFGCDALLVFIHIELYRRSNCVKRQFHTYLKAGKLSNKR